MTHLEDWSCGSSCLHLNHVQPSWSDVKLQVAVQVIATVSSLQDTAMSCCCSASSGCYSCWCKYSHLIKRMLQGVKFCSVSQAADNFPDLLICLGCQAVVNNTLELYCEVCVRHLECECEKCTKAQYAMMSVSIHVSSVACYLKSLYM